MAAENPFPCRTITGEAVASPFRTAITTYTATASPRPKLLGLLANASAPSRSYAEWTAKACKAVGIDYELREIGGREEGADGTADQGEIEEAILEANMDDSVHGIMVYVSSLCWRFAAWEGEGRS